MLTLKSLSGKKRGGGYVAIWFVCTNVSMYDRACMQRFLFLLRYVRMYVCGRLCMWPHACIMLYITWHVKYTWIYIYIFSFAYYLHCSYLIYAWYTKNELTWTVSAHTIIFFLLSAWTQVMNTMKPTIVTSCFTCRPERWYIWASIYKASNES